MEPHDICNRSIDALGVDAVMGSLTDGSRISEVFRRIYGPTLRQLLRAAHWSMARKKAPVQLLADSSLNTPGVQTFVEHPWRYAYAWPIDGVLVRWLPWNGTPPTTLTLPPGQAQPGVTPTGVFTLSQSSLGGPDVLGSTPVAPPVSAAPPSTSLIPLMSNLNDAGLFPMERPAKFLVTTTDRYPVEVGIPAPGTVPDFGDIEGVGPTHRRIILTNVQNARPVYTYLALEIELWDELFTEAMVAVLASKTARTLISDKKEAIAERDAQIRIAKKVIGDARVASHQEAGFPQSINHTPDWLRARRTGPAAWHFYGAGSGPGVEAYGWDSFSFVDGSVM